MKINRSRNSLLSIAVVVALLAWPSAGKAGLVLPYTPDSQTLHLWHLDEDSGVVARDAVSLNPIVLTNIGWPVGGPPWTNTVLGTAAFVGLGKSVSGINKGHVLFGGSFSDVSQFCNPSSGAFTFEALVKFGTSPLAAIDAELVSGDNGQGLTARGWQWRIFNGVMEWNLLAGSGGDNDFKVALPATGPNAAITGAWYHVAVSFTGESPTNSDPANVLTFYWTLLDENRVAADKVGEFTMTRPLNGSPLGTAQPGLGVAGSARNTSNNPGNNEGLIGSIDEVRISLVARGSNQMAFTAGGTLNPPSFTTPPPRTTLVGYGQTLTLPALASGSLPLSFTWLQNGTPVPSQNQMTLVIPKVTFAAEGNYQLVVTNASGVKTSEVAQVVVGAIPKGLTFTGLDTNGILSAGNIPDPNWTLARSADPMFLGPDLLIFEYANPIQFADPNGAFSPTNGKSMWIGPGGNQGGVPATSPPGQYVYRARFLIDSAEPSTVTVGGNLWANGSVSDILLDGKSTGIALAPGGTLYVTTFSITNGFVSGWNTLDFVENLAGAGISGLRVEISGVGLALPAGVPSIIEQPASQTVRDGSKAVFSVAALGRPPLGYQWRSGGVPIPGATERNLTINNPSGAARNFDVLVSNDSGSVTSTVAALTVVGTNQAPNAKLFSFVSFGSGQTLTIPMSDLVQLSTDPDHDPIGFSSFDSTSTNGAVVGQNGANLEFTPTEGYAGLDQFTYTITDQMASSVGNVRVLQLQMSQTATLVAPGGNATISAGMQNPPQGYSFQWQLNGTNLTGAVSGQLTIASAHLSDSGTYRVVVTDPGGQTWAGFGIGLTVGISSNGSGLTGNYFGLANGSTNFTGLPALTRIDPTIDFNFATDAPDPSLPTDYFQVRWHGQVQPLFSDVYTFSTTTDDGARLWVANQLLVDRWRNQGATTVSGSIHLTAGQKYPLVLEYYENTGPAVARLSWASPHQPLQVIPASQLFPGDGLLKPRLLVALNGANASFNWAGTFTLQSAPEPDGPWTSIRNSSVGPYSTPAQGSQKAFYRLITPVQ